MVVDPPIVEVEEERERVEEKREEVECCGLMEVEVERNSEVEEVVEEVADAANVAVAEVEVVRLAVATAVVADDGCCCSGDDEECSIVMLLYYMREWE